MNENEQEGKAENTDDAVPDVVVPVYSIRIEELYQLNPCMTSLFPFIPKGDLDLWGMNIKTTVPERKN